MHYPILTAHRCSSLRAFIALPIFLGFLVASGSTCPADDWMTWASTYTHDPVYGQRVDQFALPEEPIAASRADFQRSGYRHYRSTLQAGQSADNMHIVEQWGKPVVPYEAWRFPYRPYSVPYDAWGPQAPYGFFNGGRGGFYPGAGGVGGAGVGGSGVGGAGYYQPGFSAPSRGFPLQPGYQNQPWFDGTYPQAPPLDPRSDAEFFRDPRQLNAPTQ